ncbi:MAG TPA: hypothetical protein VNV37_09000 [Solirubrobacteraceae bacterium]|jgi:hypothetical protein|nr:hypothetical protein [Solirubrobacteraceae bacterium]
MSSRGRLSVRLLGLGGVASALALCALLVGHGGGAMTAGALYVLPAALLMLALACGRYPGERVLMRLRRMPSRRAPRAASAPAPRRRPATLMRGGRLIAVSLAGRAPPLAAGC